MAGSHSWEGCKLVVGNHSWEGCTQVVGSHNLVEQSMLEVCNRSWVEYKTVGCNRNWAVGCTREHMTRLHNLLHSCFRKLVQHTSSRMLEICHSSGRSWKANEQALYV
jgi:hypothetical protein